MPVSFDFKNAGGAINTLATDPGPITNTDTDSVSGTQSVTFTISTDATGGQESIVLGNGNAGLAAFPLFFSDFAGPDADVWTLRFEDTAVTANTQLSATAGNPVNLQIGNAAGQMRVEFLTTAGGVANSTIAGGGTALPSNFVFGTTNPTTSITGIRFTSLNAGTGDSITLNGLSANALNCYLQGTHIATPDGEVAVETLQAGDTVLTADGRHETVRWLGHQHIDTRLTHPAMVNPICISAGALDENVPARDLYLSPDHAIELDGMLINAAALVNGQSITQLRNIPLDGFTYYHIETDAHELLIAEGCAAESFIDYSDTFTFDNRGDRVARVIPEMNRPRIASERQLPAPLRNRLFARARQAPAIKAA